MNLAGLHLVKLSQAKTQLIFYFASTGKYQANFIFESKGQNFSFLKSKW